jgi:hypothetical protein
MKCFKFTIDSDNGTNGLYRVNSQQNHELTKLLNEQGKYKIVISKFLILSAEFDETNEIDKYYITVSFLNLNFINSFNDENNDNKVLRITGTLQTSTRGGYILTCEEFFNVNENNAGIYSSDKIFEQGNIKIELKYYDPLIQIYREPNYSKWLLEFFIIFD